MCHTVKRLHIQRGIFFLQEDRFFDVPPLSEMLCIKLDI